MSYKLSFWYPTTITVTARPPTSYMFQLAFDELASKRTKDGLSCFFLFHSRYHIIPRVSYLCTDIIFWVRHKETGGRGDISSVKRVRVIYAIYAGKHVFSNHPFSPRLLISYPPTPHLTPRHMLLDTRYYVVITYNTLRQRTTRYTHCGRTCFHSCGYHAAYTYTYWLTHAPRPFFFFFFALPYEMQGKRYLPFQEKQ